MDRLFPTRFFVSLVSTLFGVNSLTFLLFSLVGSLRSLLLAKFARRSVVGCVFSFLCARVYVRSLNPSFAFSSLGWSIGFTPSRGVALIPLGIIVLADPFFSLSFLSKTLRLFSLFPAFFFGNTGCRLSFRRRRWSGLCCLPSSVAPSFRAVPFDQALPHFVQLFPFFPDSFPQLVFRSCGGSRRALSPRD